LKKTHETQENKDQSVDTSPCLRIGNKTPMEGVTETKFGAEVIILLMPTKPHPSFHVREMISGEIIE
jgi:hypothetical protein